MCESWFFYGSNFCGCVNWHHQPLHVPHMECLVFGSGWRKSILSFSWHGRYCCRRHHHHCYCVAGVAFSSFFMFYSPCIYTNFPVMLFRIKIRITPVRPLHTKTGQTKRCGAHKTRDKAITDGCICKSIYTLFSIHFHSEKHFCFLSLNDTIKNTHTHKHNSRPCLNAWKVQKITANGNNTSQLGEQNQSRMSHSPNQRERE